MTTTTRIKDHTSTRTAQWFRDQAEQARKQAAESWERSDNDGYLSQWAAKEMAGTYEYAATVAGNGYVTWFQVIVDLEGNVVSEDEQEGQYGYYWFIKSAEGKARYFTRSKAATEEARIRNNAKKGYAMVRANYSVTIDGLGNVEREEFIGLDVEARMTISAARKAVGMKAL